MRFYYNELDDADARVENLTLHDVLGMIEEHNDYFGTKYETIGEFNDGEPHREFGVTITAKNDLVSAIPVNAYASFDSVDDALDAFAENFDKRTMEMAMALYNTFATKYYLLEK